MMFSKSGGVLQFSEDDLCEIVREHLDRELIHPGLIVNRVRWLGNDKLFEVEVVRPQPKEQTRS